MAHYLEREIERQRERERERWVKRFNSQYAKVFPVISGPWMIASYQNPAITTFKEFIFLFSRQTCISWFLEHWRWLACCSWPQTRWTVDLDEARLSDWCRKTLQRGKHEKAEPTTWKQIQFFCQNSFNLQWKKAEKIFKSSQVLFYLRCKSGFPEWAKAFLVFDPIYRWGRAH